MRNIKLNWFQATLLIMPLVFIMYKIFFIATNFKFAYGMIGVLVFFSFSLFFFLRRHMTYSLITVFIYYCIGIIGALAMAYTQEFYLILPLLLAFFIGFRQGAVYTKKGESIYSKIEDEKKNRAWFKKIIASPTQQGENKNFIIDFILLVLFLYAVIWLFKYFE